MLKLSEVIAKMKKLHEELGNLQTYLTFKEKGMITLETQGEIEAVKEVCEILEREVNKLAKQYRELQQDKIFTDMWNSAIILKKEEGNEGETA